MTLTFDVLIEIPKGSRNKYEVDHESGKIRLDRVLFTSMVYPTDYVYIEGTLGGDADPLLEELDLLARRGAQFGVKVRERLIEQKGRRLAYQRAGERNALPLAAGELARPPVKQVLDPEQLRRPFDFPCDLAALNPLGPERKRYVVAHGIVRIEPVALEHHGDAPGPRRHVVDDIAADDEVAARLLLEPADDAQKRRLAAAGRAEQNHELAVRDCECDAVDGRNFTEFLDDISCQQRSH